MKDFVFAPKALFSSISFVYDPVFFIGTQHGIYVCPDGSNKLDTNRPKRAPENFIEGKKAQLYLLELVNQPTTTAEKIHEVFTALIALNNSRGENNVAYLDLTQAKRIRLNVNWIETSIAVGFKESLLSEKYMVGRMGKPYKKDFANFYLQFYKPNKMLKAEQNFK